MRVPGSVYLTCHTSPRQRNREREPYKCCDAAFIVVYVHYFMPAGRNGVVLVLDTIRVKRRDIMMLCRGVLVVVYV